MSADALGSLTRAQLAKALCDPHAYPHVVNSPVVLHETHISMVFLAGEFAYKVKKPIKTDFLNYSTLKQREFYCHEEMRLDSRYAKDLYLGVVPISQIGSRVGVDCERTDEGNTIEYAVKMRRFPNDALLSEQLKRGTLSSDEIAGLAKAIAHFHAQAPRSRPDQPYGAPSAVLNNALDNLHALRHCDIPDALPSLHVLETWTNEYFSEQEPELQQRVANRFIRECHGDLHLANIVEWRERLVPFDGIEFNDQFRWIDVLSDAAFLAMDLAARGHLDLSRSFLNTYLDHTGDHASLSVLRWYLVYRAMVRAKVAMMRWNQNGSSRSDQSKALADCKAHIDLAYRFTLREAPRLWITHGLSGSGKSTVSELVVQRQGAIRLRSDVERKRHYGLSLSERPDQQTMKKIYTESANHATYGRLRQIARSILLSGYSVIIDATFLKRRERDLFHEFAINEGVDFAILDCHADETTLRQRIADRSERGQDASDADVKVLKTQLATQEPLTPTEQQYVVDVPDIVSVVSEAL